MQASDLFDPPAVYVSKTGHESIQFGRDFHEPRYWRTMIASMQEYAAQLEKLCDQQEKAA